MQMKTIHKISNIEKEGPKKKKKSVSQNFVIKKKKVREEYVNSRCGIIAMIELLNILIKRWRNQEERKDDIERGE